MSNNSNINTDEIMFRHSSMQNKIVRTSRRSFLVSAGKSVLISTFMVDSLTSLALGANTLPPSSILYFETGVSPTNITQWLFVSGKFTWSQAMKMSTSVAITDPYGPGWLLAPMLKPEDFVNAANVTKKAMGDLRGTRGPFIGVFQSPGGEEPRDGFMNLNGSVPFLTWGKSEPNDGAPLHRNILREKAFRDALKAGAQLVVDWYMGDSKTSNGITGDKITPIINFVVDEISRPESKRPQEDVVALWHEKDGSIKAFDTNLQTFSPVLLSRRKPIRPPAIGSLPSWPKVRNTVTTNTDLFDGMKVPRRSTLYWKWTGGAGLGQVQVVNLLTGKVGIQRDAASTPNQDLTSLLPGSYMFRIRNITKYTDPWLEIGFTLV